MQKTKEILKKIPPLRETVHWVNCSRSRAGEIIGKYIYRKELETIRKLGSFAPNTAGYYSGLEKKIHDLTLLSANQIFPLLVELSLLSGKSEKEIISAEVFCKNMQGDDSAAKLKSCFDAHKCDKALSHNYHCVYGPILKKLGTIDTLLEIGLGTTNTDVVSNMGGIWKPGASLRAFRDFLPQTQLYGADFDKRILFEEERIQTFFVDQTDSSTLEALGEKLPHTLDLIIDDGLHAPNANLAVLIFALKKLRVGGWLVIEDIAEEATVIWRVTASLLSPNFQSHIIRAHGGIVFAVEKLG